MSIEELLNPRFEVIADFPNNIWEIGNIVSNHQTELEKYPHLFRKLHWFGKRSAEEMPIFIKSETKVVKPKWELIEWRNNKYWQANEDEDNNNLPFGVHFNLELFTPATEEEYLSFINKA